MFAYPMVGMSYPFGAFALDSDVKGESISDLPVGDDF